jgi:Predicted dehydrogenases and related proteins
MIDTLRFLIGEIVEVNGKVDKLETKAEIYDTALATFRFDNGAYGFVGSIFVVPKVTMVNVYGTKASLYSSDKLGLYIQRIESEELEKIQYNEVDPVLLEQEDFARSVIEKRKPLVDGYEGMRNVAIMEAIIKSSQDKRPVEVREILN